MTEDTQAAVERIKEEILARERLEQVYVLIAL